MKMPLFVPGEFTAASGKTLRTKIECDALTAQDWDGIAELAFPMLPPFAHVNGVPRGGIPFAKAMEKYAVPNEKAVDEGVYSILVCEDVITTGGSVEKWMNHLRGLYPAHINDFIIVCAFARGKLPDGYYSVFSLGKPYGKHVR
jgi:orotate phosphoribosyltransferase